MKRLPWIAMLWVFGCNSEPRSDSGSTAISSRLSAKLTVNPADWDRLWHPAAQVDAGPSTPAPPNGPPPKEATDACAGQLTGAACAFTHEGQGLSGQCGATPEGQRVCIPSGAEPPPPNDPVLGGTLAGLTSTPALVAVRPTAEGRVTIAATIPKFSLEPADAPEGGVDLWIDHGAGFERAGRYLRITP